MIDLYDVPLELQHHGVKGMKWGVRKERVTRPSISGSDTKILNDKNGDYTISKNSAFNRVSRGKLKNNDAGGLYITTNADDNARYIKNLGPSLTGRILKTNGDRVLGLNSSKDLKIAGEKFTSDLLIDLYKNNSTVKKALDESLLSTLVTDDLNKSISNKHLKNTSDYTTKSSIKLSTAVSSLLGDPNSRGAAKIIIEETRKKGYDGMVDLFDKRSGTSNSPAMLFNTDGVKVINENLISKEQYKKTKKYIRTLDKIPINPAL